MTLSPLSVNGNSHPPIGFVKVYLNYIFLKKHYIVQAKT